MQITTIGLDIAKPRTHRSDGPRPTIVEMGNAPDPLGRDRIPTSVIYGEDHAPGEQTHAAVLLADDQAVTVMLDFVEPLRSHGRLGGPGRNAWLDIAGGSPWGRRGPPRHAGEKCHIRTGFEAMSQARYPLRTDDGLLIGLRFVCLAVGAA
jgi:hypothetical protein